jgi:hypothetical protein
MVGNSNFNQLLELASNKENLRINQAPKPSVKVEMSKEDIKQQVYDRCLSILKSSKKSNWGA